MAALKRAENVANGWVGTVISSMLPCSCKRLAWRWKLWNSLSVDTTLNGLVLSKQLIMRYSSSWVLGANTIC